MLIKDIIKEHLDFPFSSKWGRVIYSKFARYTLEVGGADS
jgi:hypothetical protein